MIHVIATIELRAGTRERFLEEFARLVPEVRAEDGCLEYGGAVDVPTGLAAQGPLRPDAVTVVEKWRDLPALEAHLAAPHMAAWRARVGDAIVRTVLQVLAPAGEPTREPTREPTSDPAGAGVLLLPGLYDSGPEHWQSRWEAAEPGAMRRVRQDDWVAPHVDDWVRRLEETLAETGPDVVLVGHSSACALVAHWAARDPARRVRGALLVAPSDPAGPNYPPGPAGFAPMPLAPLPFPSIVVASRDDEYVTLEQARAYAAAWGSRFVEIGAAGHINSASGLGDWAEGRALLAELERTA